MTVQQTLLRQWRWPIILAALVTATLSVSQLRAADPVPLSEFLNRAPDSTGSEKADDAADEEPTVRLNFINRSWTDVLQRVAKETNSTLVMPNVPRGHVFRPDLRAYTRTEAVEILNRELKAQDYRIVEKGDFLVVMSGSMMDKHYQAAVIPRGQSAQTPNTRLAKSRPENERGPSASSPGEEYEGYQRNFETIVPASGTRPAGLDDSHSVMQVGGVISEPSNSHPLVAVPHTNGKASSADSAPVTLTVRPRHNSAVSLAKRFHEAFGRQSELIESGIQGLPAFRVVALAGGTQRAQRPSFEVEINTQDNELLVTAPQERAKAVANLLRSADATWDVGEVIRVTPAGPKERRLAHQLQPVLAQFEVPGDGPGGEGNGPPGRGPNGERGPGRDRDGNNERPQSAIIGGELPALIGNLRGEVSIESVPGLGVLILRGNDQDVQAVLQVIQALEKLSAGQQPVIELLKLEHLDSAALATLLEEVYGQLATVRNDGTETPSKVAVIPVVKPNSVLIIAAEGGMPAILDLAAKLDRPLDPAAQFQAFSLENALASQAAETLETFYEERVGLGTKITVVPVFRTNMVIVSASPRDLREVAELLEQIDQQKSGLVNQIEIIPLQSAAAQELANVITQAIQSVLNPRAAQQQGIGGGPGGGGGANLGGGGQSAQQLTTARSAVIEFLDQSGDVPKIERSGLLADIRITPDPRTNSLIVTADEQGLAFVQALVHQLDRPAAATAMIKIFTLENSDATNVVELLNSLFGLSEEGDDFGGDFAVQLAAGGVSGGGLIPLRFAVDTRTNSVIASGSAQALQIVRGILITLDESDIRERKTVVVKLKNSPAQAVATAIQNFVTSQRELLAIDEDLVSSVDLLEREIIVVPEPVSNSLLVSATPRYYEKIREIIDTLDKAPPQVIIQALLVEVSLDNTDEFGVELGLQGSTLFDRSLTTITQLLETTTTTPNGVQTTTQQIISQTGEPGFNFNGSPLGNNTSAGPGSVGTQGLSNFALGRANSELGYGGFVFSASSANVSVLLRALSAKRSVQILSRPQIRTLDNQMAQILVGQNVPVVNSFVITNGIATPIVVRDDAGLILNVVPRISPDGNVVMEVQATRSAYRGEGVPIFVNANDGTTITAPIKDITTAFATVSVPTGQTIVMGGIISRRDDTIERKVPYLGDIPYVGSLFRYDSTTLQRKELLIFLTPRVIYNAADNELIKQVEAGRMHFIEAEAEAIHGPLYAVPPAAAHSVPPVLTAPAQPRLMPAPQLGPGMSPPPNNTEVLPGLPAEACPPGIYPPGTLFEPVPSTGSQSATPVSPVRRRQSASENAQQSQVTSGKNYSTVRTLGEPVASGRLADRAEAIASEGGTPAQSRTDE